MCDSMDGDRVTAMLIEPDKIWIFRNKYGPQAKTGQLPDSASFAAILVYLYKFQS
jgi:hypothetical protein